MGHVRDLPRNAADVPAKYKGEPWASLGVDVDNDFAALYVVSPDRTKQVTKLKALLKDSDELLLATDEDREGEAIAWHLVETLKPKVPVKRMVFHEITRPAIQQAVANPRDIDQALVDAQEARRILDRLYGYEVSPVLWKKVMPKGPDGRALSAGRVQSVATRIVVERERERMRFRSAEYWDIRAILAVTAGAGRRGPAHVPGHPDLARRRPHRHRQGLRPGDRPGAGRRPAWCTSTATAPAGWPPGWRAGRSRSSGSRRSRTAAGPYAPFITSTLQQEAGRKLRYSSAQTMRTAQRLYENGYITYMRTDSVNLSETAIAAARTQIAELFGDRFVPPQPRSYTGKVKNAQEAHEAIRPAGDVFRTPGEVANELSTEEFKLYELIWRRTIASQMTDAVGSSVSVRIRATSARRRGVRLRRHRQDHHRPRLPQGLRGVVRRRGRRGRGRRAPAAQPGQGPAADRRRRSTRSATPPSRRPATPRRRWSRRWRSWASAARRRTRRSCRRSRTAGTCSSAARR